VKTLFKFIQEKIRELNQLQNYGNALEQYILANNPTSIHDVEKLERQFDKRNSRKNW
jgi:hypothetical protein